MITKIPQKSIDRFEHYVEKWTNIGRSTERFTQEEAEEIIHNFQRLVLEMEPTPVEVYDGPELAWEAVKRHVPDSDEGFVEPYQTGSFFAPTFSFYDFFISEGLVEVGVTESADKIPMPQELFDKYKAWEATSKLGFIFPLDNVCVVSQKINDVKVNETHRLHCETGPALTYPSGWKVYALNGVEVPEYLVMTPSEDLSLDFFTNEKNADVKAEFVRKFGVERMLEMGKKIDSYENYDQEDNPWWWKSEYELWDMAVLFDGLDFQPYLKMKNQTTGIWHVEACSPACTSLELAIKERFGGEDLRIISIH
jgi:hypothetical protein